MWSARPTAHSKSPLSLQADFLRPGTWQEDLTLEVEHFQQADTNRVLDLRQDVGGKGINVVRVLKALGYEALACGFIGLRDDRIAALWKGFHACQHYDGDGWNGATEAGALELARRFRGKAVFQTDNSRAKFQAVMDAMRVPVTWADSGLGAHATAMFLDDRPSTQELRRWFRKLVTAP